MVPWKCTPWPHRRKASPSDNSMEPPKTFAPVVWACHTRRSVCREWGALGRMHALPKCRDRRAGTDSATTKSSNVVIGWIDACMTGIPSQGRNDSTHHSSQSLKRMFARLSGTIKDNRASASIRQPMVKNNLPMTANEELFSDSCSLQMH